MFMGGITRPRTRVLGYRAEQVAAFVMRHLIEHGEMPTQQQICNATGIASKGEVSRIERALSRRGLKIDRRRESANPLPRKPVINGCPT
jgi:uncharacterized membrane protein